MQLDLDKVFAPETIRRFNYLAVENLTHSYSDKRKTPEGKPIPFEDITQMLAELRTDVEQWHQQEYGIPMDTFNLGERRTPVTNRFYQDKRFQKAFELLGLNQEDIPKATIPWWNEVAAGELDYELTKPGVHVRFGPRHSLETQLMRQGVERPVKNVSVGSLVLSDGKLILGLRGGASYPNTYHISAGALRAEDSFKTGESSVYDMFVKHELTPELGLTPSDSDISLFSRIDDKVLDKGPMYVFLVKPNLTYKQFFEKWVSNLSPDKKEHNHLIPINADSESVNTFIRTFYRGQVENSQSRSDNEKYLLHPGALALASFSGMSPGELRGLYKEGVW